MNISDLLTILTILLAAYTILPKARILDIKLRLTILDWLIILTASLLLLYLQFYEVFYSIGLTPNWNLSKYNLNPNNFSFVVVLLLGLYLILKTHFCSLSKNKLTDLKKLFEQLNYNGQSSQIVSLLDEHYSQLVKFYAKDKFSSRPSKPKKWLNELKLYFDKRFNKRHNIISDVFEISILNPRVVNELTKTNPYLGINILHANIDLWDKKKFCELYLKALLNNSSSILYSELNKNHETTFGGGYKIPEKNKLLYFLFSNVKKAEEIYAWQAIGEEIIAFLIDLRRNPEKETYNLPYDRRYQEELQFECPLFSAIHFFDIMVTEAIYQNIKWHMWLHYFEYFTEEICKNYRLDSPHIDRNSEFPNRYSYLLYMMRDTLCKWVSTLNEVPVDQENIRLDNSNLRGNPSNIIQSGILALGSCTHIVYSAPNVPELFKRRYINAGLNLYFDILTLPNLRKEFAEQYADLLLDSLLNAGNQLYKKDQDYNSIVLDTLLHIDFAKLNPDNLKNCRKKVVKHFITNYGEQDSKYVSLRRSDTNTLTVESKRLKHGQFKLQHDVTLGSDS
jgi:hypothetical protein